MLQTLASLADLWIGRRAAPVPSAVAGSRGPGALCGRNWCIARHRLRARISICPRRAARGDGCPRRGCAGRGGSVCATGRGSGAFSRLPLDVTDTDAAVRLEADLREAGFYADVLVNNAGMGLSGQFSTDDEERQAQLIALNIAAATRLMRHALPRMVARGRGGILNVSSLGGLVPGPHQAAYYASKAYLISLTEAVGYEARGQGVRIATVAPGPVETGFHQAMEAESALYRRIVPALSADAVAASAYRGFMIGRRVIVPGFLPTAAAVSVKVLPHALTVPMVAALLAPGSTGPDTSH